MALSQPAPSAYPRVVRVLAALGNTSGRISRADYILSVASALLVILLTGFLAGRLVDGDHIVARVMGVVAVLSIGVAAAHILAASVRRLHDLGQSGRFALLMVFPPVTFLMVLLLCLFRGNDGPNRYGPPPANR